MKYTAKKDTTVEGLFNIHYAGASRSTLKNYLKHRQVKVNDELVQTTDHPLKTGDVMEILKEGEKPRKNLPFRIIHEDDTLIVVEKPVGILTSGEGITKRPTLHKMVGLYLEQKTKGKVTAHVVHRLDKEVGGLVLFAKSEKTVRTLQDNWKKFTKKYLALSRFTPPEPSGTIDTWLAERNLKMHVVHPDTEEAVHAVSHYKWLRFEGKNSLIEVTLDTGKKNQIRVHLASIGCPIIGDEKYGDEPKSKTQVRLMSYFLEIIHPATGKKISWQLDPPKEFLKA